MLKKYAVLAVTLLVASIPSQAKTTPIERAFISHKRSELKTQIAIRNALVHAIPKHQRRLLDDDDNDDAPGPDELDLQSPYSRPRIVNNPDEHELSDYVLVRLAVARARAMEKYRQKYTQEV